MGTPERFYHVSCTQLSVARLFGGCKFNGVHYVYDPTDDTLTREDVFKKEQTAKRQAEMEARKGARQAREARPKLL